MFRGRGSGRGIDGGGSGWRVIGGFSWIIGFGGFVARVLGLALGFVAVIVVVVVIVGGSGGDGFWVGGLLEPELGALVGLEKFPDKGFSVDVSGYRYLVLWNINFCGIYTYMN